MLRNATRSAATDTGAGIEFPGKSNGRDRSVLLVPLGGLVAFAALSPLCWHLRSTDFFVHEAAALFYLAMLLYSSVLCAWAATGRWRHVVAALILLFVGALFVAASSWNVGDVTDMSYSSERGLGQPGSKMAILGFFCYPSPDKDLPYFMQSLRATGSQAEVFIFCNQNPSAYEAAAKRLGFTFVNFAWKQPAHPNLFSFSSLRFRLYLRLLQELHGKFSAVMICDVRDVFFQADPATLLSADGALVFAGENNLIELPGINAQWISQCFGHAALARVRGRQVSCSGTVLGGAAAMEEYLALHVAGTGVHPLCASQGVDQGVHNLLVWTAGLASRMEDWRCGRILTVDNVDGVLARGGVLRNCHGEPYAIVHQWNRCRSTPAGAAKPTLDPSLGLACHHFPPALLAARSLRGSNASAA